MKPLFRQPNTQSNPVTSGKYVVAGMKALRELWSTDWLKKELKKRKTKPSTTNRR